MQPILKRPRRTDPAERYKRGKQLGEGTFGIVYEADDLDNNSEKVAVKQIKQGQFEDGVHWTALREIKLLRELSHENVMGLLDVFATQKFVYLVFEYCELGTLEDVIRDDSIFLGPADVMSYTQMILRGIKACHDSWILHRDLKPANLLIHSSGSLKIADFGLARIFGSPSRDLSSQVVTLWYRAPELLFGSKKYGVGVDMWSVGLILFESIRRVALLPGNSEIDQLSKAFQVFGTPTEEDWPGLNSLPSYMEFSPKPAVPVEQLLPSSSEDARSLFRGLMQLDPNKRLTADQALAHPYFSGKGALKPTPPSQLPRINNNKAKPQSSNSRVYAE